MINSVSPIQPLKEPIVVTDSGSVIFFKLTHSLKPPTVLTPVPNVIDSKLVHPLKASEITSTLLGISMDLKDVHPVKVEINLVTELPKLTVCMLVQS